MIDCRPSAIEAAFNRARRLPEWRALAESLGVYEAGMTRDQAARALARKAEALAGAFGRGIERRSLKARAP